MDISERVKGQLTAFILRVMSGVNFHPLFLAEVVTQHEDFTLDLRLESPLLPGLTRVPIGHGLPRTSVRVKPGATVLVGFANGNPMFPFVAGWLGGEVEEIRIADGNDAVALARKVAEQLTTLKNAIDSAAVADGDGGAAFKAMLMAALANWPGDVGAEKVKAS